jgi:hypothetical protein
MQTLNKRKDSLNVQKSILSLPILAFFAQVLKLWPMIEHKKKIAKPPVNMPPKPELTSDQRKQVVSQLLLLLIQDGI